MKLKGLYLQAYFFLAHLWWQHCRKLLLSHLVWTANSRVKLRSSKLLVWEKIASRRDFLCSLGTVLERLEINPPSRVQRRLLQMITHIWTDSGFYRASHRTGVSCLNSALGRLTRRNPRLCLYFVDKNLHWWLCINMQENQSYCLRKPFPVAETQSWTSSCFKFCCQLIDENPYSTWKSEKQKEKSHQV